MMTMFKRIKIFIEKIFKKERCFKCNKILSYNDKKKGGCGYNNGKFFGYCISCSKKIIRDMLNGKEPNIK